eukprot:g21868.t1
MTGYGDARRESDELSMAVEVRSVNNRYFKIAIKSPDTYSVLDGQIEKVVRNSIHRGTVSVVLRADRATGSDRYRLNQDVLSGYWKQLHDLAEKIHVPSPHDLGSLLQLPGAILEDDRDAIDAEADWPLVRDTLEAALEKLQAFRETEGRSMQDDLSGQCAIISEQLEKVEQLVPEVVAGYRDRLLERVRDLVDGMDVEVGASDLIREVSIFAERADINEEITRLRSHLEQFDVFLNESTSQGRKLEFLGQEMNREVNTIGSKANNVAIAHCVVEMKDYYFLTPEEFERRKANHEFLEYAEVFGAGYWYGTLRSELQRAAGQNAWALLEIDVEGALNVVEEYPDAVTVFLTTSSPEEYERRLRSRGTESEEVIQRRLATAASELKRAQSYKHIVVNDDLDRAALTGRPVHRELFAPREHHIGEHIGLPRRADLLVVAPASANFLAKSAGGLADDLLSTVVLAATCPILLAPAMNTEMWSKPAVQRNVAQLREDGFHFIDPTPGWLSCRDTGSGRMAEPVEILARIRQFFADENATTG